MRQYARSYDGCRSATTLVVLGGARSFASSSPAFAASTPCLEDDQAGQECAEGAEREIAEGVGVGGLEFGGVADEGYVFAELPDHRGGGAEAEGNEGGQAAGQAARYEGEQDAERLAGPTG